MTSTFGSESRIVTEPSCGFDSNVPLSARYAKIGNMCGRFTLRTPTPVLAKTFRVETVPQLQARFNIAPTQDVGVIRPLKLPGKKPPTESQREFALLRWGLIPSWADDAKIGSRMINARSETAATKPSFRSAFRKRRCLVIADGYYEWEKVGTKRLPFHIQMKSEEPFAMAGLWEIWKGDEKTPGPVHSCTVLTTESNELTSDLHDRMPVILPEEHWGLWLDPELTEADPLLPLMVPYASDEMKLNEVNTFVNNARNEGPECLEVERRLF